MKYNKSLDLMACAVLNLQAGKPLTAGKLFTEACSDPSINAALKAIEASNAKGFAATAAGKKLQAASTSKPTAKVRAGRAVKAADEDDEEDLDLDDEGDDEEVEAAGEDDSTWPFTAADEDDSTWPFTAADEDEDLVLDEDGGELSLEGDADGDGDGDDEFSLDDDGDLADASVQARKIAQARFMRALANMQTAAKKKPVKKAVRRK